MEWNIKDYGAWVVALLALFWAIYSSTKKDKKDETEKGIANYSEIQVQHITESSNLRRELRDMLREAVEAKERIEKDCAAALKANDANFGEQIKQLKEESERRAAEAVNLKKRETELENALEEIREKQNSRIEIEADIKEQNRLLEEQVKILRTSNREIVQMYETQLYEKDKELVKLKENIAAQGKAIQKLKEILDQNGITANVEV